MTIFIRFSIAFCTFCFSGCNTNNPNLKAEYEAPSTKGTQLDSIKISLLNKAINSGDFSAYNKISSQYILKSATTDFFFYAFIMANKHNCPEACYHVYHFLNIKGSIDNTDLFSGDRKTQEISLFYLCKFYELGFEPAKVELISIFGKKENIPKSTSILPL